MFCLFPGGSEPVVAQTAATNLLTNAGFSNGMTGWHVYFGTSSVIQDPSSQTGNTILRVSGNNTASVWQDISAAVVPGNTYLLTGQGRLSTRSTGASATIQMQDANGKPEGNLTAHVTSTSFATFQLQFRVPPTVTTTRLTLAKLNGRGNYVDFDNLSLTQTNAQSITPAATNGVCGAAASEVLTAAPTTQLCSAGTASAVTGSGSGPWSWTCVGAGSGANATAQCATSGICASLTNCPANVATLDQITLSSPIVYPTNQLQIKSTLTGGTAALSNGVIETIIQNQGGTTVSTMSQNVTVGTKASDPSGIPVTFTYTVPDNATLPAGVYTVSQGYPTSTGLHTVSTATFTVPAATNTLNEEFDDGRTSLNMDLWSPMMYWSGTINSESEYYVPNAVSLIPNQGVQIRADINPYEGQPYTSGAIASYNGFSQTYGHFEMKAQLPAGNGFWPAFWLFSNPAPSPTGEIDIFEYLGDQPATIFQTLHDTNGLSQACKGQNWSLGTHVYSVDWQPTSMTFSIDGVACTKQPANAAIPSWPMYIIANFAIGSSSDWAGSTNAATPFPAFMNINYIKAWQYPGLPIVVPPARIATWSMSPANPEPGQTVTVTGTIAAGDTALSAGLLPVAGQPWTNHGLGWNLYGASSLLQGSINAPAVEANSSSSFTYTMKIPANWTPGIYRSSIGYVSGEGVKATTLREVVIGDALPDIPPASGK